MARIIQQSRFIASVALVSNQVIHATSNGTASVKVTGAVANPLGNELIAVRILSSLVHADSTKLTIQASAFEIAGNATLRAPAYQANPLGQPDSAAFQGQLSFHAEDIGLGTNADAELVLVVFNSDSSDHNITEMDLTVEVIRSLYDEPVQDK